MTLSLGTRCKDGMTLVISSSDGYCSFVTFEEGELGQPHSSVMEGHKEPTQVLQGSDLSILPAEGAGLHTPSSVAVGPSGCETTTSQQQQSGNKKARRVGFITLSRAKPVHMGNKAEAVPEGQHCQPAPMDQS